MKNESKISSNEPLIAAGNDKSAKLKTENNKLTDKNRDSKVEIQNLKSKIEEQNKKADLFREKQAGLLQTN